MNQKTMNRKIVDKKTTTTRVTEDMVFKFIHKTKDKSKSNIFVNSIVLCY